jgi:NADH dehydrogenase [ubiquinone] 1 alpha subcomplex assembly factor 1
MNTQIVYDFNSQSDLRDWRIIDDVVMGGRSNGNYTLNKEGHGIFSGEVSTENNGGFSSVRYQFKKMTVSSESKIVIRLKGDGKEYQFRVKDKVNAYYSYITTFQTTGEWQSINIQLKDLYPSFRGRTLDLPNFHSTSFEEIVFLIGNKKNESFRLELDKIELVSL